MANKIWCNLREIGALLFFLASLPAVLLIEWLFGLAMWVPAIPNTLHAGPASPRLIVSREETNAH